MADTPYLLPTVLDLADRDSTRVRALPALFFLFADQAILRFVQVRWRTAQLIRTLFGLPKYGHQQDH